MLGVGKEARPCPGRGQELAGGGGGGVKQLGGGRLGPLPALPAKQPLAQPWRQGLHPAPSPSIRAALSPRGGPRRAPPANASFQQHPLPSLGLPGPCPAFLPPHIPSPPHHHQPPPTSPITTTTTPGRGNAAPWDGHPELAGGPRGTLESCHHAGDAAHAEGLLDQAPPPPFTAFGMVEG